MKYAFAGAALIAGAMAVPAWQQTHVVEQTIVATITSCGPEVTNCPASSTTWVQPVTSTEAWTKPTGAWGNGGSWSESWSATSSPAVSTPVVSASSSAPWTSSVSSAPVVPVSSSSTWVASSSSTWVASSSTPVSPVSSSSAPVVPVSKSSSAPWSASWSSSAAWSTSSGVWSHSTPVSPVGTGAAPSGKGPVGTGAWGPKPTGTAPGSPKASGTGSYTSIPSKPVTPYTGGAAQNAAGLIAGVGAIAAFFL